MPPFRRAAGVLHLEGEAGVGRAVGICGGREAEIAAVDRGQGGKRSARCHLGLCHSDAIDGQRAGCGQRADSNALEAVGRAVVGIAEAEFGRGELSTRRLRYVVTVLIGADRSVVHAGDVDRQRVGRGSRSTPPLAVPPSSCTWKVKLESGEPLALACGTNCRLPAVMSLTAMNWPTPHRLTIECERAA